MAAPPPLGPAPHPRPHPPARSPPVRLEIDRDRSKVLVGLPEDFTGCDRDKEGVTRAVTAKLAIEAPDASWKLDGRKPLVTFTRSEPPPSRVTWDDVAAQVDALGPDDLMIGPGKKASMVTASLASDSPHLLIAMGTGGGKSNTAAFWLVQQLRRGAIGLILDAKHHSHPWAFKDMDAEFGQLPNVGYARRTQDLHDAMVWLGDELDRRNQVALRAINAKGDILGDVGPRLFIVAEELNLATPRLKQHWAEIRDKEDLKKSPALTGMGEVAFAGRAVKMHLIVIGQMLTAESLGGGAVRENMGVRCMARYTQNSWKMLAGDMPMPPSPSVPGRVQCLTSGTVREAQVPLMDLEQARELAVGGVVTPCPAGMPGISREAVAPHLVPASRAPVTWPSDQGLSLGQGPVVPPARPPRKTLSEAHAEGMFGDRTLWAVRKAVQRARAGARRDAGHRARVRDQRPVRPREGEHPMTTPSGVTASDQRGETWKPAAAAVHQVRVHVQRLRRHPTKAGPAASTASRATGHSRARCSPVKPHEDGYVLISHRCDSTDPAHDRRHTLTMHRLVLTTFDEPCPPGMEACHSPPGRLRSTGGLKASGAAPSTQNDADCRSATAEGGRNGAPAAPNRHRAPCIRCGGLFTARAGAALRASIAIGQQAAARLRAGISLEVVTRKAGYQHRSQEWVHEPGRRYGDYDRVAGRRRRSKAGGGHSVRRLPCVTRLRIGRR